MPCENLVALMFSAQALSSGKQLRGAGTFGAGAVSDDDVLHSDHADVIVVIGGADHARGFVEEDHLHRLVVTR